MTDGKSMQFYLQQHEAPADAVVRINRELFAHARDCLDNREISPDKAVHEVRLCVKRLRAVLQLAQPALGKKSFSKADRKMRDFGRLLSGKRDTAVALETFNQLVDYYSPFLSEACTAPVREALQHSYDAELEPYLGGTVIQDLYEHLATLEQDLLSLDYSSLTQPLLLQRVGKTYRRGLQALRTLEEVPATDNSHELRRQVKYLFYQLRLLRKADPACFKSRTRRLNKLGELLGHDHDLAILTHRLHEWQDKSINRTCIELVNGLAETRRVAILSASLQLAGEVYSRKPGRFFRWLDACMWD